MSNNKLKLDSEKTNLILFSYDRTWRAQDNVIELDTGNEVINVTETVNVLGGIVSRNLKWEAHLLHDSNCAMKKLSQRLSAIKQICNVADFKTRKMMTNGLFMSKLAYLMPLWGGCQKFLISSLQVMQNKAARYVTKKNIFTPTKVLLKQCGWMSVNQMVFFHTLILFYKTRQSKFPTALYNMASSEYSYNTREKSRGNFKVVSNTRLQSSLAVQSFRWRSVEFWNKLPMNIKTIEKIEDFKKSLKEWTFENISITP